MSDITRFSILKLAQLSLLLFISSLCFAQKDADTLNVSLIHPMPDVRPFVERTSHTASMALALYDGLFRSNLDGEFVPSIATALETTNGGKHHHFTLRSDAKWSDGSRLVAEDFARGLRLLLHSDVSNYIQKSWVGLEGYSAYKHNSDDPSVLGIRVIDDTHLSLFFTQPVPFIKFMVSSPNLVPFPPAAKDPSYWKTPSVHLFNGRYKVDQPLNQFPILLEPNPYYSGEPEVLYKKVYVHRHDKNEEHAHLIADVREGLLDIVLSMPKGSSILKETHHDILVERPMLASGYVVLNTQKAPFNDPKVRLLVKKIINMAHAKSRVIDNADNYIEGVYFVPRDLGGIRQLSYTDDEIEQSRRLLTKHLKSIGYSKSNRLKLQFLANDGGYGPKIGWYICGEIINKQGVLDCDLKLIASYKQYRMERRKRDYHFITASWSFDIPYAVNLLNVFTTGHSSNHALWSDEYYDQMIDNIKSEQDLMVVKNKSIEAEDYFLNQTVIMPIGEKILYLHAFAVDLERSSLLSKRVLLDFVAVKRRDDT